MRAAVTGGAGFIGSHLADALISEGHEVYVIDNLSSGSKANIPEKAVFMKRDICNDLSLELEGMDVVFHLAADPDVRASAIEPKNSFDINVGGTFRLLESCRKADIKRIVFPSTSTVYGDAELIPTPETYPCAPISNYGASKLACEAYLSSYSGTYGIKATTLRLANIFGERSSHGVMFDFFNKLSKNPREMEILGDGKQDKSYLHVSDCVSAIMTAWEKQKERYDVFNVGSREKMAVSDIAKMMCRQMGLLPELRYTGTPKGWPGDVRLMLLDASKLERLGWKQETSFEEGLRRYIGWLDS
ncbi:MAG: NAD-dependent epimerase/dehydratase family protein [Candidatus Micrarchaeota archaeon]